MNQIQILELAQEGLQARIEKKEAKVRRGYQLLADLEQGKEIKAPKNEQEIKEIIKKLKGEIEELAKQKFDLGWEVTLLESE